MAESPPESGFMWRHHCSVDVYKVEEVLKKKKRQHSKKKEKTELEETQVSPSTRLNFKQFYLVLDRLTRISNSLTVEAGTGDGDSRTSWSSSSSLPENLKRAAAEAAASAAADESTETEQDIECIVCMEREHEVSLVDCSHAFCEKCWLEWKAASGSTGEVTCPLCRSNAADDPFFLSEGPSKQDLIAGVEDLINDLVK